MLQQINQLWRHTFLHVKCITNCQEFNFPQHLNKNNEETYVSIVDLQKIVMSLHTIVTWWVDDIILNWRPTWIFLPTVNMISYNIDRRVENTRKLNIEAQKKYFILRFLFSLKWIKDLLVYQMSVILFSYWQYS